jgi:hypothetical protein
MKPVPASMAALAWSELPELASAPWTGAEVGAGVLLVCLPVRKIRLGWIHEYRWLMFWGTSCGSPTFLDIDLETSLRARIDLNAQKYPV